MSAPDVTSLRALAERLISEGEWRARLFHGVDQVVDKDDDIVADCEFGDDAAFIAAANPTAVLALLDEVERLRATVARAGIPLAHLERLAQQLREQGDVQQVLLKDEGVSEAPSLGEELWLIGYNLRAALETP